MVVRYEMTAQAAKTAYWYRWKTSAKFKAGVLAFGVAPAVFAFAIAASILPDHGAVAVAMALVVEIFAPVLFGRHSRSSASAGRAC